MWGCSERFGHVLFGHVYSFLFRDSAGFWFLLLENFPIQHLLVLSYYELKRCECLCSGETVFTVSVGHNFCSPRFTCLRTFQIVCDCAFQDSRVACREAVNKQIIITRHNKTRLFSPRLCGRDVFACLFTQVGIFGCYIVNPPFLITVRVGESGPAVLCRLSFCHHSLSPGENDSKVVTISVKFPILIPHFRTVCENDSGPDTLCRSPFWYIILLGYRSARITAGKTAASVQFTRHVHPLLRTVR